jgi:hypothetical protein
MAHGQFRVLDSDIRVVEPPPRGRGTSIPPSGTARLRLPIKILWTNCAGY